jgi:hypothetical protein
MSVPLPIPKKVIKKRSDTLSFALQNWISKILIWDLQHVTEILLKFNVYVQDLQLKTLYLRLQYYILYFIKLGTDCAISSHRLGANIVNV